LLGILTIETVLLPEYSSQPQRAFTSKPSLHSYRPLRFSRCSHAQQKVLLSSFSASDNVLVTYVLTVKKTDCPKFSTLRSGGPLADDRQVDLDRAQDLGSGQGGEVGTSFFLFLRCPLSRAKTIGPIYFIFVLIFMALLVVSRQADFKQRNKICRKEITKHIEKNYYFRQKKTNLFWAIFPLIFVFLRFFGVSCQAS
jgi:hypothetical protein